MPALVIKHDSLLSENIQHYAGYQTPAEFPNTLI